MSNPPNYDIVEDSDEYILIRDLGDDNCLSITKGAEIIVDELSMRLDGRKLYYIDSEGYIDQLLHENGMFMGFAPTPIGQYDGY